MLKRSLDRATRDPETVQTKLLLDILRRNRDTEYGKEHGFSRIVDPDAFIEAVPINTFADLAPYVEKMKNGQREVLTADQPLLFCLTSGTTDEPKYVPITRMGMAAAEDVSVQWLYRSLGGHPSFLDQSILCITGAPVEGNTRSGIPYGSASGMIYKGLPRVLRRSFVLPFALSEIKDYGLRYYAMARVALEKEVSFIATPNPTTLIRIAETGILHQEEIIRSISDGVLSRARPLEASDDDRRALEVVRGLLKPNRPRARRLEQIIGELGKLMPFACWPDLKLIGCWLGGSVGFQAEKLSTYFGTHPPKRDLGYLASEGSITIPYEDRTPAGILSLYSNYYEFIPDGESVSPGEATLRCHELEQGKQYRIILTNQNGLYRYDIHDVVVVDGFYGRTPVVAFVGKGEDMLSITGEKLHVNHFLCALRNVKDELGVSVIQFRAVPNHEELRYEILMQVGSELSRAFLRDAVLPCIDRSLSEANLEYAGKRESKRLNPPFIHVMDSSWEEDVRGCMQEAGYRDIQYKWRLVAAEFSELDAKHIRYTVQM